MIGSSAGYDVDGFDLRQVFPRQFDVIEPHHSVFIQPPADGFLDAVGLLVDLLDHEMRVPPLGGGFQVPGDLRQLFGDSFSLEIIDFDRVPGENRDVSIFQEVHIFGVFEQGGNVRGDEVLSLANPDHEGAVLARSDQNIRTILVDDSQGVSPSHPFQGFVYRPQKISPVVEIDEMRNHFRVGLGFENDAVVLELILDFKVIFDDAVMDHRQGTGFIAVRVRVGIGGLTVGCPPCMADAHASAQGLRLQLLFQEMQSPFLLLDDNFPSIVDGNAGRIVPPVFQPGQPVHDDFHRLSRTDITHYSAHTLMLL